MSPTGRRYPTEPDSYIGRRRLRITIPIDIHRSTVWALVEFVYCVIRDAHRIGIAVRKHRALRLLPWLAVGVGLASGGSDNVPYLVQPALQLLRLTGHL